MKENHVNYVYVAAPFQHKKLAAEFAREIDLIPGYKVKSRWLLEGKHELPDGQSWTSPEARPLAIRFANEDVEDVKSSDIFVLLAHPGYNVSQGRNVELGLALAWCDEVLIVGEPESIFHLGELYAATAYTYLFESMSKALDYLRETSDAGE
jgi:hypothetical protein